MQTPVLIWGVGAETIAGEREEIRRKEWRFSLEILEAEGVGKHLRKAAQAINERKGMITNLVVDTRTDAEQEGD